jgi:hypothetical protein
MYSKWFRHPDGDLQANRTSQYIEISQVFVQIQKCLLHLAKFWKYLLKFLLRSFNLSSIQKTLLADDKWDCTTQIGEYQNPWESRSTSSFFWARKEANSDNHDFWMWKSPLC